MMGGMSVAVDGKDVEVGKTLAYKAMMLENVPNLAFAVGYSNASFTLKVDLTCDYVCKLLAHMDAHGYDIAVPVNDDDTVQRKPILDLQSGYVERGRHLLPHAGRPDAVARLRQLPARPRSRWRATRSMTASCASPGPARASPSPPDQR